MVKKIIIASITLVFLIALAYTYFQYRQIKTPVTDALDAIPGNAAIIFQSNDLPSLWEKINENNIIWEELITADYFEQLNKDISLLDSLIHKNIQVSQILKNQPVFLSAHLSGSDGFHFLLSASIPSETDESFIHGLIIGIDKNVNFSNRNYESSVIYTSKSKNSSKNLSYSISKGVFIASFSPLLVEEAIHHLNGGHSIAKGDDFNKIHHTAGTKVDGNIFISYKNLAPLLATFVNAGSKNNILPLSGFANWAAIDFNLKPNALMLNGFAYSNDSTNNYLNLFLKQKPQNIEITRVMPFNTATFLFFGFSNFSAFHKDYKTYLNRNHSFSNYEKTINQYNSVYETDIENQLLSWIGNEAAVITTEPAGTDYSSQTYALFRTANLENARNALAELTEKISAKTNQEAIIEPYKDFEIKQLNLDSIFPVLLGAPFSKIQTTHYINIGRYFVFGNSSNSLKVLIDHFLADRTLQKDLNYNLFSDNLSNEANIYLYSNIARSTNIYKNFVKENYSNDIDANIELFRKFEAVAFQVSSNNSLFYNNIYLKHNPVYKQETTSLWETQLDTTISSKPRIVTNHTNDSKEIFAQDDGNKIYLISNTGKILWKKQLDEKIMSDVYQLDIYKNNKLQLIFNTASKIYVLDRNGNNLEKFPLSLKTPATNAISLLDYENNRDYRIIIACEDNRIYNYTTSGELVKGWAFNETVTNVTLPVQYLNLNGKDYLIALDNSGKIYIFDRRGETRIILKEKLYLSKKNDFYIEKGKGLANTKLVSTDSTGNIVKLNLIDELENISIKEFSAVHFFDYKDLNNDRIKEYIITDGKELNVYDQDKMNLFKYEFAQDIILPPMFFLFPDYTGKIGIVNSQNEELFLFDEFGGLFKGLPLKGVTSFSIGDINKDGQLNIVVGSGKNIFAYSIK